MLKAEEALLPWGAGPAGSLKEPFGETSFPFHLIGKKTPSERRRSEGEARGAVRKAARNFDNRGRIKRYQGKTAKGEGQRLVPHVDRC